MPTSSGDENQETIAEEDLESEIEESREPKRWVKAKQAIEQRCQAAGIETTSIEDEFNGDSLRILFPNGSNKRVVYIGSTRRAEALLDLQFEDAVYLGEYTGLLLKDQKVIEAEVKALRPTGPLSIARHLFGAQPQGPRLNMGKVRPIRLESSEFPRLSVTLKFGTSFSPLIYQFNPGRTLVLRIEGYEAQRHDEALTLLEKISNPLFFSIDTATGIPLSLTRERKRSVGLRKVRRLDGTIEFPKFEYDPAPMSLYWYGRGAVGMPLLQYLAFYQVIEFYFPTYSTSGAARRLRTVLKNPNFRADRDADIGKLLSVIGTSRGPGFGSERAQLRVTIQECLDPASLRAFFDQNDQRHAFFVDRKNTLTKVRIPFKDKNADLREGVADMLYEIRCKIVHTKGQEGEEDFGLLLPFSPEADLLANYIDLIQYVAEQVLITSSTPLRIHRSTEVV